MAGSLAIAGPVVDTQAQQADPDPTPPPAVTGTMDQPDSDETLVVQEQDKPDPTPPMAVPSGQGTSDPEPPAAASPV